MDLNREIKRISAEKNAIILAHNYQNKEIQEIADITGDSLELSLAAAKNKADIIVFCGVHFMAESAKIISPEKKVILPEPDAGCPMADMAGAEDLLDLKKKYPDAKVVTYINSSAEIKAHSDVICTSSNAKKIVDCIDADEIIFLPDRNLGSYIQRFTKKKIILWDGFCPVHEKFSADDMKSIREKHPGVFVMVHPECRPDVIDMADAVFSTGEMVKFVKQTDLKKIVVGTEKNMIHKLRSAAPGIEYIPASETFTCPNMNKINIEKLHRSLIEEKTEISVDKDIAVKARRALEEMFRLSY